MRNHYVARTFDRLYAVRWVRFELNDLHEVRDEIRRTRKVAGKPLIYLSLIPPSPRTFTDVEHQALAGYVRDLLTDCESIHHVIAGEGFVSSARRSIVTQLALAAPKPKAFATHRSLEEALAVIAPRLRMTLEKLLADARAASLDFPAEKR